MDLKGKTAFVTGGTGFVGGRLVEQLVLEQGMNVRVLVRNVPRAVRAARFNVELIDGSLTDEKVIYEAIRGCDYVFNCAFGTSGNDEEQRAATVDGTEYVAKASLDHNVKRLVHLGTAAVYESRSEGVIDEEVPRKPNGWFYSDIKLESEEVVLRYHREHNLPGTIVQLANVYGPWAPVFTIAPLQKMRKGKIALVNGGSGICNATYVDDVIQLMLKAAINDASNGEIFIAKGAGRVTYREFHEAYAHMLNVSDSLVDLSAEDIRKRAAENAKQPGPIRLAVKALRDNDQLRNQIRETPLLSYPYRFARWATPDFLWRRLKSGAGLKPNQAKTPATAKSSPSSPSRAAVADDRPLYLPDVTRLDALARKVDLSSKKAEDKLGYQAKFDLDRGMQFTGQWAKWAGLLD